MTRMKLLTRWRLILILVVLGLTGWQVFARYWYYLPGIVASIKDPIGPTQEVVWTRGTPTAAAGQANRPPNVILILADDLGWNDTSFNGGGIASGVAGAVVPTPRMDSIARDGVNFMQAYAGNATCAPSRAAIMTGRYATRFGFEFTPLPKSLLKLVGSFEHPDFLPSYYNSAREQDVPNSADELTVPTSETMIGQVMKNQGYHTLMLGKWHLGATPQTRPESRGFDEALAFYDGASMYLPRDDRNAVNSMQDFDPYDRFSWANLPYSVRYNGGKRFAPDAYMTDYLGTQAVRAIEANKDNPFFMYLSFNAPHTPLQALKSDYDALDQIKDHRLRVYAAMVRALDRNVGKVLDALKAQGLDDNTMVIFSSDNGGAYYLGLPDINKPFRGWKSTFFEGGIHVPFFVKWPKKIPQGLKFNQPIGHVDIFATAAAAAGAKLPTDRVMDGIDLLPFVNQQQTGSPHKSLYWRDGEYRVLLAGDWKLQTTQRPPKAWLYQLSQDPTEQHNLADTQPAKVAEMRAALQAVDAQQAKPLWPSLLEKPVRLDRPLGSDFGKDDAYIYWAN